MGFGRYYLRSFRYYSEIVEKNGSLIALFILSIANGTDRELIEIQWRHLATLKLQDISIEFDENVDTTQFWIEVSKIENANGDKCFKDLASFAIRTLSLPISNAVVERVFSVMAVVETKLRNRMLLPMLMAIIRIRSHMSTLQLCCKSYNPTKYMVQLFNSNMYMNDDKIENEYSNLIESLVLIEDAEA